jgi:replicative superfamily II helicase
MILFDRQNDALAAQDLGRIAARYYVRYSSIEIFNGQFRPIMTEADVLAMLSMSTEVRYPSLLLIACSKSFSLIKFKSVNQKSRNWNV